MLKKFSTLAIIATTLGFATSAAAQDKPKLSDDPNYTLDKEVAGDLLKKQEKQGWDWAIAATANLSFSDNQNTIGQVSGSTLAFGFSFGGQLNYYDGPHEFRSSLGVIGGVTKTPVVDEFIKNQDTLDIDLKYLFHFNDWMGAYANAAWKTTMFRTTDIQAVPTTYNITRADGTTAVVTGNRLSLTDPFLPSRFKQSLGVFAQPYKSEPINVEVRLGVGARETLAEGQLAITAARNDANVAAATELADVIQLGAAAALELRGAFEDKRVTWSIEVEAMTPFVNNLTADDDRGAFELTNVTVDGNLAFNLVSWASLTYNLAIIREPQLVEFLQVQNNLQLNFNISAGTVEKEE